MDVVEVTLKISVPIDDEYSPAEHAADIVSTVRHIFTAADVKVIDVQPAVTDENLVSDCLSD